MFDYKLGPEVHRVSMDVLKYKILYFFRFFLAKVQKFKSKLEYAQSDNLSDFYKSFILAIEL